MPSSTLIYRNGSQIICTQGCSCHSGPYIGISCSFQPPGNSGKQETTLPSIPPRERPIPTSRWQEPEPGWICLNVDASATPNSSFGSIEGVFRNRTRSWILGFQKQIGVVSVLQAELWAIFIGLQIA
ncbi:hypothetical protein V6N13_089654 [Hibiscus sabdariffa]